MGYNLTRYSVKRNQVQLEQLMREMKTVKFPTGNPKRLADRLREALAASYHFPEYRKYYDSLHHLFKFKIGQSAVIAEFTGDVVEGIPVEVEETQDPVAAEVAPSPSPSPPLQAPIEKTIIDATDLVGVMAILVRFPNDVEIRFPSAVLNYEEKSKLFSWIEEKDYGWKMIDQGLNGITLTHKEDVPEDVIWTPTS